MHAFVNNTTASLRQDSVSSYVNTHILWHDRLGHVHPRAINVLEICNISLNNKKSENLCHACCLGKCQELHAPLTHIKYSCAFELLQLYLLGPSPKPSRGGNSYYLSFVEMHIQCIPGFTC